MNMRHLTIISAIASVLLMSVSCEMISNLLHDDEVVAKVGRNKLYRGDVESLIPEGIASEDSLAIAQQYINTWAADLVFQDVAQQKLSKSEKNLTKEIEQYTNALLKYRYEQLYINERLDTAMTDTEVNEYYEAHKETFKLNYPIVKARFIRLIPNSINTEVVRKKISSDDPDDQVEFDNIVYSYAEKYNDFGGRWVEITSLAREFGTDYGTVIAQMSGSFVEMKDADGRVSLAYISNYLRSGNIPPVEFCHDKIENVIISVRKQALLNDLERDLLEEARESGLFETFE